MDAPVTGQFRYALPGPPAFIKAAIDQKTGE